MRLEVLAIDGCPGRDAARARTRAALVSLGLVEIEVGEVVVATTAQAAQLGFRGSPSIVLDGEDLFPDDAPAGVLACRVYRDGEGLANAPSVGAIVDALRARGIVTTTA